LSFSVLISELTEAGFERALATTATVATQAMTITRIDRPVFIPISRPFFTVMELPPQEDSFGGYAIIVAMTTMEIHGDPKGTRMTITLIIALSPRQIPLIQAPTVFALAARAEDSSSVISSAFAFAKQLTTINPINPKAISQRRALKPLDLAIIAAGMPNRSSPMIIVLPGFPLSQTNPLLWNARNPAKRGHARRWKNVAAVRNFW
jgi:hypothetical protein